MLLCDVRCAVAAGAGDEVEQFEDQVDELLSRVGTEVADALAELSTAGVAIDRFRVRVLLVEDC